MNEHIFERQVAIKLSQNYVSRLDDLAKQGKTNRRQLMVNFIRIWLDEIKETNSANFFHLAIVLREIEADFNTDHARQSEYVESIIPEKQFPFPILLTEDDNLSIVSYSGRANMTRHHLMKSMIITGIGELEEITKNKEYEFSAVKPKLKRAFGVIMAKGRTAFMKGRCEQYPLKRIKNE